MAGSVPTCAEGRSKVNKGRKGRIITIDPVFDIETGKLITCAGKYREFGRILEMSAPSGSSQNRHFAADFFRPAAAVQSVIGQALLSGSGASSVQAKTADMNGQIDLTLPLRGLRFVFKGRVTVGTAAYTSVTPENLLNLVSKIRIIGNYKGNSKTICDCDLANLFALANAFTTKMGSIIVSKGAGAFTEAARPALPYPSTGFDGTVSTFDFVISFDLLFGPYNSSKRSQAGFIMRKEDWTNVNVHLESPALPDNSANALGVSAATTTTSVSGFQQAAGTGSMTADMYLLPVRLGKAASSVVPGVLTRAATPLNAPTLQAAMNNTLLLTLDKKATTRVFVKVGTGAAASGALVYSTLSDAVLTQAGLLIGSNTNVRQPQDIFAVKSEVENEYEAPMIQGVDVFDFINHYGNQDSSYPADGLTDNQPFRLVGSGPGTANAQGHVIQEEIDTHPQGSIFG